MQYRIAGISFEHMHMGDNLRMARQHPLCDIVGICDSQPERMRRSMEQLSIPSDRVFTDWQHCIDQSRPDVLLLCPSTGDHAVWVERLAPFGLPILIEKPMAASLSDADAMIATCQRHNVSWAINWPLVWVASHRTTKRLIDEGRIGEVLEVHYYDGNRGPLWHTSDKAEITAQQVEQEKPHSWFYKRSSGGGSLLDYLGYGVTLGTWFNNGQTPLDVTTVTHGGPSVEVDEHSITIVRYRNGLSKFETRWGTFTDPWVHQPQPQCGFVIVGSEGTISSYDYQPQVIVQDRHSPAGVAVPADEIQPPYQNPIQYFIDCLQSGRAIEGPLSPAISRIGQQIVDAAMHSSQTGQTISLIQ